MSNAEIEIFKRIISLKVDVKVQIIPAERTVKFETLI